MSNALMTTVPSLDGTNYRQWALLMEAYLQSQGQWTACTNGKPTLVTAADSSNNQAKLDEWDENNVKVLGNIKLRLSISIRNSQSTETLTKDLWEALSNNYRQLALGSIHIEMRGIIETQIPANSNPAPALAKLQAHWDRLQEVRVPSNVAYTT